MLLISFSIYSGCATKWQTYTAIYLGSAIGYIFIGGDRFGEKILLKYEDIEDDIIEFSNDTLNTKLIGLYDFDQTINLFIELENKINKDIEINIKDFIFMSDYFNINKIQLINADYLGLFYSTDLHQDNLIAKSKSKISFALQITGVFIEPKNKDFVNIILTNHLYKSDIIIIISTENINTYSVSR